MCHARLLLLQLLLLLLLHVVNVPVGRLPSPGKRPETCCHGQVSCWEITRRCKHVRDACAAPPGACPDRGPWSLSWQRTSAAPLQADWATSAATLYPTGPGSGKLQDAADSLCSPGMIVLSK
jgi:hypothetical protein